MAVAWGQPMLSNTFFRNILAVGSMCLFAGVPVMLTACGGGDGDSRRFSQIVTANKDHIVSIKLADNDGFIHAKGTRQFILNGVNADGETVDISSKASWSVSDPNLAEISQTGLLTPKVETADLILNVSFAGLSASQPISISNANLVSVSIEPIEPSVDVCKNTSFTGKALLENGLSLDYPLQWRLVDSASTALASFPDASKGELHTYKSGVVKVVAEGKNNAGESVASSPLEYPINNSLISLQLASSAGNTSRGVVLYDGRSTDLKVTAGYNNSNSADITANARLSINNTNLATLDGNTGKLTARNGSYDGEVVTVSAYCDDQVQELAITIIKAEVQSIEIHGNNNQNGNFTVDQGSSTTLTLTATFEDNAGTDTEYLHNTEWTIDTAQSGAFDPALITLNNSGRLETSNQLNLNGRLTLVINVRVLDEAGNTKRNRAGQEIRDTATVIVLPRL